MLKKLRGKRSRVKELGWASVITQTLSFPGPVGVARPICVNPPVKGWLGAAEVRREKEVSGYSVRYCDWEQ